MTGQEEPIVLLVNRPQNIGAGPGPDEQAGEVHARIVTGDRAMFETGSPEPHLLIPVAGGGRAQFSARALREMADRMDPPPVRRGIPAIRQTHTYAVLEVSRTAWNEVAKKLIFADYQHAFHRDSTGMVIDMHGIALQAEGGEVLSPECLAALGELERYLASAPTEELEEFLKWIGEAIEKLKARMAAEERQQP